jgi:hypothetical protein
MLRHLVLLLILVVLGCNDNSAANKANFEACVQRAEQKYRLAFSQICIHREYVDKAGECSYSVADKNALLRSKDNEITACAAMFAPKK